MQLVQSLRQKTALAMTPRMQASVRILAMNNNELSRYLAEQALDNPYLDVRMPQGLAAPTTAAPQSNDGWDPVMGLASRAESLYGHVGGQIALAFPKLRERRIAESFAEALEPSGWLSTTVEDVAAMHGCSHDLAEDVLATCQEFEPAGLFARSLAECLGLQARDQGLLTPVMATVLGNLPMVANGEIEELARIGRCSIDAIRDAIGQLRGFDPKPGQAFLADPAPVFPPDLTARRVAGGWQVELNHSHLPAIDVLDDTPRPAAAAPEERAYCREALSSARWLAQALERRQTTLLRTGAAMVRRQAEFLDHGPASLKPMTLEDIAEELDLHPSTISRASAGRMIDTPRGALPMKAFFSRAFHAGDGGEGPSQQAMQEVVRKIVSEENPERPLSDTAIAKAAAKRGSKLARRTVAKYREALGIPSSYDRKRKASLRAVG
ncbi:MAG: RNA polymerase factor sigma-54 [Mangrovicoccus sp.]